MGKQSLYANDLLKIQVKDDADSIQMEWTGRSVDRDPGKFITPILVESLRKTNHSDKRVLLDFRKLEYMNSSTITPIIKALDRAKRGATKITVLYDSSLKWQDLAFSALEIFQTADKSVEIKGL
jgi:anti-anti-sigma regulatory factor